MPQQSASGKSISIHALRVEGDPSPCVLNSVAVDDFYPRPPGGGRPDAYHTAASCRRNFYPRPPGGGRQRGIAMTKEQINFYPRPPGGGRRVRGQVECRRGSDFYPRPPGGGRLGGVALMMTRQKDFYPRPPGGGRHKSIYDFDANIAISIHALRVEGDHRCSR